MAGGRFQASAKRLLGTTEKSASRRITEMGTLRYGGFLVNIVIFLTRPQAPHNQPR